MIGATISHYEILEKLGEGGMGAVYKARDPRLGRTVAIKVVNAEFTQRFEREARAIAALNHPHICTLHDVGEHDGAPYLVMEYVEGQPLKGPLPTAEALRAAMQIGEALAAAHKAGIVHRDLKPDNILLTREGRVKVLDFGLAKLQRPVETDAPTRTAETMTTQGTIAGTGPYMSPEQAQGEAVDARSDIFSFGAVLYELLSGRRAFGRETLTATLAAVITQEPPPLKEAPADVARIVGKMLAKPREARYQSAEAVLADLHAAAAGAGLAARRRWLAGAAALVMVIAAGAAFDVRGWRTRLIDWMSAPAPSIRLAVLPFANLSGDPAQEYLSDGLTQEMIVQLGSLHPETLSVIARTSVMRYRGSNTPIDQVGRELGVDYILEGSAQQEAGRVRITADLIRVRNQAQLWEESFEREMAGVLALQSEVAKKVAGSLALRLLPAEQARLASARPVNSEAYESYLKGLAYSFKFTPEDLDAAMRYFELALEKDPRSAPAYAGISWVWIERLQLALVRPREGWPKAREAALRALELDETLAEAHQMMASIQYVHEWDWPAAEAEYRRAIELNPNCAAAYGGLAEMLAVLGRGNESERYRQQALELDPNNLMSQAGYGMELLFRHRYDDGVAQLQKVLRMDPNSVIAHLNLFPVFANRGMYPQAFAEEKAAFGMVLPDREVLDSLESGYAHGGYREANRLAAEKLEMLSKRTYVPAALVAQCHAEAGQTSLALDWLENSYRERESGWITYLPVDPAWDTIRNEPRFQALVRRLNLPQ
jgi:TolB-like protein/tRNA A-37 threonylcarbamoyl transferase component Bud32